MRPCELDVTKKTVPVATSGIRASNARDSQATATQRNKFDPKVHERGSPRYVKASSLAPTDPNQTEYSVVVAGELVTNSQEIQHHSIEFRNSMESNFDLSKSELRPGSNMEPTIVSDEIRKIAMHEDKLIQRPRNQIYARM